jgi:Rrf2 family protein
MLSKKALYAVRALTVLAKAEPMAMTTAEIARAQELPRKFLEAILLDLKRAGITVSARGRDGGYRLNRAAESITLADIIRTIDGPLAMMPCASVTSYRPCDDCLDVEGCRIRKVFARGRDAVAEVFEGTSVADLVDRPEPPSAVAE